MCNAPFKNEFLTAKARLVDLIGASNIAAFTQ